MESPKKLILFPFDRLQIHIFPQFVSFQYFCSVIGKGKVAKQTLHMFLAPKIIDVHRPMLNSFFIFSLSIHQSILKSSLIANFVLIATAIVELHKGFFPLGWKQVCVANCSHYLLLLVWSWFPQSVRNGNQVFLRTMADFYSRLKNTCGFDVEWSPLVEIHRWKNTLPIIELNLF